MSLKALNARIKGLREDLAHIEALIAGYRDDLLEARSLGMRMLLEGNIAANQKWLEDNRAELKQLLEEKKALKGKPDEI